MSKFKTFDITLSKEGKGVQIDAAYEQLNIHSDQTNGYYYELLAQIIKNTRQARIPIQY